MYARRPSLAAVVTLVGLSWPLSARAQAPLPATPVPIAITREAPAATAAGTPVRVITGAPTTVTTDAPPVVTPGAPQPSPLRYNPPPPPPPPVVAPPPASPFLDPGPGGWGPTAGPSDPPGLFFNQSVMLAFPSVKFTVGGNSPNGPVYNLPTVDLPATVSPLFELGYRLPAGGGLFAVSYRFLVSEQTEPRAFGDIPTSVRTRLNINVIDLDYGADPVEFAPRWVYSWRLGARIADIFFDNTVQAPVVYQQFSNKYFGAGPHARLDVERRIVLVPGLALTGGIDGAMLIGQVQQRFREQASSPVALIPPVYQEMRRSQAVPYLNVQLGLSYVPPNLPNVKFAAGYQFEEFFNVGKLGVDGTGTLSQSRGEVWAHGAFLRGQVDF